MEKAINSLLNTKFILNVLALSAVVIFLVQLIAHVFQISRQFSQFVELYDVFTAIFMSLLSCLYQPLILLSLAKIISLMDHKNAQN